MGEIPRGNLREISEISLDEIQSFYRNLVKTSQKLLESRNSWRNPENKLA